MHLHVLRIFYSLILRVISLFFKDIFKKKKKTTKTDFSKTWLRYCFSFSNLPLPNRCGLTSGTLWVPSPKCKTQEGALALWWMQDVTNRPKKPRRDVIQTFSLSAPWNSKSPVDLPLISLTWRCARTSWCQNKEGNAYTDTRARNSVLRSLHERTTYRACAQPAERRGGVERVHFS